MSSGAHAFLRFISVPKKVIGFRIMDRSSRKHCKKRLILVDSDSSSGSDEVKQFKCRKVLQRITPTRSSPVKKVNILDNVQICPPSTAKSQNEIDTDSESDILSSNEKYRKICHQFKQDNKLFVSPSSGKKYGVLKNAEVQSPGVLRNPSLLTPTQKCKRENNCNQSRASSPDSLNIFGETSRCSSLSNISYSNLLPVQLREENMQELIKSTSSKYTKTEKQEAINNNYVFIHSFGDENTGDAIYPIHIQRI